MGVPITKFSEFVPFKDNIANYEYEAINYLSDLEPYEGNLFWAGNFSSGSVTLDGQKLEMDRVYGTGENHLSVDGGAGEIKINFKGE